MSDIIFNNPILYSHCSNYIELCKSLNQEMTMIEKDGSTATLLQQANLHTKYVLCELQILKVQVSLQIKVTEKQIVLFRNKFAKIIGIYQKLFIPQIPWPMQEVAKRIELINSQHEKCWLQDIRILGLALTLFANYARKSNSYLAVLNHQYQFTGIFRNSILCKNLRPQLGADNHMCNIRREQLMIFRHHANDQIAKQRAFSALTQSLDCLGNAIRIIQSLIELGFITENEFFDTEFYKKQEEALTKVLIDTRDSAKK